MANHPGFPMISVSLRSQKKKQNSCRVEMPLQRSLVPMLMTAETSEPGL